MRARLIATAVCAMTWASMLEAQGPWTGGPTGPVYYNGGNVGIGTNAPSETLQVQGGNMQIDQVGGYLALINGGSSGWGMNLQLTGSPYNNYKRGILGSNVLWNESNKVWSIANNGGSDYSALYIDNGGAFGFSTAWYLTLPTTLTDAQFVNNTKLYIQPSGNVGIGTTNPSYKLEIQSPSGSTGAAIRSTFDSGYMAPSLDFTPLTSTIPTNQTLTTAVINGRVPQAWNSNYSTNSNWISSQISMASDIGSNGWVNGSRIMFSTMSDGSAGSTTPTVTERMRITSAGLVGIGTTSPTHTLTVIGTISAQEVLVTSSGADYVFKPGYRLAPLGEVANYIEKNHHLPGIPPADEVQESGLSLGDMQSKLLAKIEELTLHMIDAESQTATLRGDVLRLDRENQELQRKVNQLGAGR